MKNDADRLRNRFCSPTRSEKLPDHRVRGTHFARQRPVSDHPDFFAGPVSMLSMQSTVAGVSVAMIPPVLSVIRYAVMALYLGSLELMASGIIAVAGNCVSLADEITSSDAMLG